MNRKAFLARTRIGLILRVFATKEDQVENQVRQIMEMVCKAMQLVEISLIDIFVWEDKRYPDADCGKTYDALTKEVGTKQIMVRTHRFEHGDIFCGILNYAVAMQLRNRVDYSIIASKEALSYLNQETLDDMIDAACNNAKAVGVAINELTESVMAGRLANTLAMWDNVALMSVGGFDLRAAKPMNDKSAHYLKGWNKDKGDVFYHLAGVEEVIPLARLVETWGPCLAPIMPQGEGIKGYVVPDPVKEPELFLRHISKMGTKTERQAALLAAIGADLSYLKGGVMPIYRNQ